MFKIEQGISLLPRAPSTGRPHKDPIDDDIEALASKLINVFDVKIPIAVGKAVSLFRCERQKHPNASTRAVLDGLIDWAVKTENKREEFFAIRSASKDGLRVQRICKRLYRKKSRSSK